MLFFLCSIFLCLESEWWPFLSPSFVSGWWAPEAVIPQAHCELPSRKLLGGGGLEPLAPTQTRVTKQNVEIAQHQASSWRPPLKSDSANVGALVCCFPERPDVCGTGRSDSGSSSAAFARHGCIGADGLEERPHCAPGLYVLLCGGASSWTPRATFVEKCN